MGHNTFNVLHFIVASQWVMAAVAIVLHAKGHTRTAYGMIASVMAVLSWLAIRTAPERASIAEPRAVSVVARASSLEADVSSAEAAFVGSSIGKTYHRPDCFYVTKQLHHMVKFATRAEAEASGRNPCTNCMLDDFTASTSTSQSQPQNQ
jgi:hypothetical protein